MMRDSPLKCCKVGTRNEMESAFRKRKSRRTSLNTVDVNSNSKTATKKGRGECRALGGCRRAVERLYLP